MTPTAHDQRRPAGTPPIVLPGVTLALVERGGQRAGAAPRRAAVVVDRFRHFARPAAGPGRRRDLAVRHRRRHLGHRHPGRLGPGDRRIRLVDRAGERRHHRLGAVLPDPLAVALGGQPDRRVDDAVRGGLRRDHADPASRPARFFLLAVPLSERDGAMAAISQPAAVGLRLSALLHSDVDHVLLRRAAARPRHRARSGADPRQADPLRHPGARLARLGAALAQSSDSLLHHGGDHGADGDLGAQCRRPRFRRRAHPRLAFDPVPALLLFRRGRFPAWRW